MTAGTAILFETTSGYKTAAQLQALYTGNNTTTHILSDGGLVTLKRFILTCGCITGGGVANTPPTAQNVVITGTPAVGSALTGAAAYVDSNGDLQGVSVRQWYRVGTDGTSNRTPIAGANGTTYTPGASDVGFRLRFGFTPVALTGATLGAEVLSPATNVIVDNGTGSGGNLVIAASGDNLIIAASGDNLILA